ncbi:hypothetical protein AWC38_SpisGene22970 [Stylophora pistillata]|uniref:Uncharacterized protein n=1 Tax=Stylophora pistillata TaxID=50429 RepID=A0A2B4R5S4_STYPI|nr:hypothetical protein AWC38_SpisGene22970 [Stylophora pistillata]
MQLTSLKGITKYNVIFEEATTNQHGHQRINIKAKHGLGENKAGPLVVASPFHFSFGVQQNLKDGEISGYYIPLPLWNPEDEPTRKEFNFYCALKELKHICYEHLDEVYGTDVAESMKFPMAEKEGKAPILYPKLMYSEKSQKIRTLFHSREEAKVDPLDFLDQYCQVKMTIVVDSIYLGDEYASVQLKINDVCKATKHNITSTTIMIKLTELKDINKDNVIFEEKDYGKKRNHHIKIKVKHACGETGPLVIVSPLLHSYLQQNLSVHGDIKGYSMPVYLSPYDSQEKLFYNALKELKNLCYEHIDEVYGKEETERMKFPLDEKEQKEEEEARYPLFYPKLMYSESIQKIQTPLHTYTQDETKDKTKVELLDHLARDCKRYTTFDVADGGRVEVNLERLKKLPPQPSWPAAFLSDFREPSYPKFPFGFDVEKFIEHLKKTKEESNRCVNGSKPKECSSSCSSSSDSEEKDEEVEEHKEDEELEVFDLPNEDQQMRAFNAIGKNSPFKDIPLLGKKL